MGAWGERSQRRNRLLEIVAGFRFGRKKKENRRRRRRVEPWSQ
jgi:hypothetical protein